MDPNGILAFRVKRRPFPVLPGASGNPELGNLPTSSLPISRDFLPNLHNNNEMDDDEDTP